MYRLKQERAVQTALELLPVAADEDGGVPVAAAAEAGSGGLEAQEEVNQPDQPSVWPAVLTLTPGQSISSRYLGLTLFYPALRVWACSR
jgi:hypothetical protein